MSKKKVKDWRSKPRKPAGTRKTVQLTFKVTPEQAEAIDAAARAAGVSRAEYLVRRVCNGGH